jgi:hypothetical protein
MRIRRLSSALALAGGMIAAAVVLRTLRRAGSIDPVTSKRAIQVLIGLVLAAYANGMPKDIGRWTSETAAARTQSVLRVGGWSLTLAGVGDAALWVFTPIAFADVASTVLVAGATLVTAGYAAWMLFACRITRHA